MSNQSYDLQNASRIYVIGDIHGRLDIFDQTIAKIDLDMGRAPCAETFTVTLGDYIDRGPNSRGVIERLMQNRFPTAYVALKGNHEELFENFVEILLSAANGASLADWKPCILTAYQSRCSWLAKVFGKLQTSFARTSPKIIFNSYRH